ncbi:MAG: sugar nucleotide-binding protein, partial [Erysipelotrichaceae bacterium]
VETLKKFFILRISWVFGINGNNFIKTMLRLGNENGAVRVVNDQIGSPTYTIDLAVLCVDMIESEAYGIYHAPNEGICSWYEFACEIFKQANMDVKVTGVSSDEFITKATRPKNSRMNRSKLDENGFKRLPTWQNALQRYLKEL